MTLPYGPVRERQPCTCRHAEASLGRLDGIDMGRGMVRVGTTPGCPEHDSCRGFTKALRAQYQNGRLLFCPKHPKLGAVCPDRPTDHEDPT